MTCGEIREYLFAFLDNELDAPLSIELQRHLDRCHDCAREVEIERTIHKELETVLERDAVDSSVADAVLNSTFAQNAQTGLTDDATGPHRRAHWVGIFAAAAVVGLLAIAGIWLTAESRSLSPGNARFAELLVNDLEHFLEEGGKLQIMSADRETVSAWLHEKTSIRVSLPVLDGSRHRLMGGRKCKIDGHPAAFAVYEKDNVPTSLVVMEAEHAPLAGMRQVQRKGRTHWVDHRTGHTIIAVRRDLVVYAAVSTLPEQELLDLVMDPFP